MKNICENEIEEIIDLLDENCNITMKEMAENALIGLNMVTKKSVYEIVKEEEKYKSDENDTLEKSKHYEEALTVMKYYLKKEDYEKIPKEKLEFYEENADKIYDYDIDKNKNFYEQDISRKANSIIVYLYREYFIKEDEKKILDQVLHLNESNLKKIEEYENSKHAEKVPDDKALMKIDKQSLWVKLLNKIRRKMAKGV